MTSVKILGERENELEFSFFIMKNESDSLMGEELDYFIHGKNSKCKCQNMIYEMIVNEFVKFTIINDKKSVFFSSYISWPILLHKHIL